MLTLGASLATSGLFVLVVFRLTKNNKEPRAWRVPYRGQVLDRKPISKLKTLHVGIEMLGLHSLRAPG